MKGNKRASLVRIFFSAVIITVISISILIGGGIIAYNTLVYEESLQTETSNQSEDHRNIETANKIIENKQQEELEKLFYKTIAIIGTDFNGKLTDTMMVAHYNNHKNSIEMMSVPRDTQVRWSEEQRALLPPANSWVTVSKLNEMSAWGGMENIESLTINELENILGIPIDHYVLINLSAFRNIVDAVGGVEIDVPQRMYKDEVDGGLRIDLQPGLQVLDGSKAEQFVRFRDYPTGDLERIKAQQQFVDAFIEQVFDSFSLTQIIDIANEVFTNVKTDISILELASYFPYLGTLKEGEVNFHDLPGSERRENGISYFFIDLQATDELIQQIIYDK